MSALTDVFAGIASAIRAKNGSTATYKPSEMAGAIGSISIGNKNVIDMEKYRDSNITSYIGNNDIIMRNAFISCKSLKTVSFPKCSYIGNIAFEYCSSLTTISFPNCNYIGDRAFAYCRSLTTASFPKCSYIGNSAFHSCSALTSLYLLTSAIPQLRFYTFNNSPFSSGGTGTIYVLSSMYTAFTTAQYWSDIKSRLVSM